MHARYHHGVTAARRRILITGVSRFWGGHLAQRLESHPDVEEIVAIDTMGPTVELHRTDVVRADIRHSLIGKLVRSMDIDTVVHTALIVDPQRSGGRSVHETNVIGTMNLLAACAGADSPVRKLVVKASTAVYGSEPSDPSFWSERMTRKAPARDAFTRDLDEVESYVHEFSLRKPEAIVTLMRFANILGPTHDTPFTRLFDLPVVPTVLGFDPRLQFLHEQDAVRVLEHAVLNDRPGTFNVAGDGIALVSQAISMMGKVNAPILPFIGAGPVMFAINRVLPVNFPQHLVRLLQFGRVVDTTALRERFGITLSHSTIDTLREHARERRVRKIVRDQRRYRYEADLEEFLRARTTSGNGHGANKSDQPSVVLPPSSERRTSTRRVRTRVASKRSNGVKP